MSEYNELEKATRKYFAIDKVTNKLSLNVCIYFIWLRLYLVKKARCAQIFSSLHVAPALMETDVQMLQEPSRFQPCEYAFSGV